MLDFFYGVGIASVVWCIVVSIIRDKIKSVREDRDWWMGQYNRRDKFQSDLVERNYRLTVRIDKANHNLARCRARLDKVVAAMRDRK